MFSVLSSRFLVSIVFCFRVFVGIAVRVTGRIVVSGVGGSGRRWGFLVLVRVCFLSVGFCYSSSVFLRSF